MASFHARCARVSALIAASLILLPGNSPADWVERPQPLAHAVYVPGNYRAAEKYPLVIVLHGNGGQGSDNRTYKSEFYAKLLADPKIQAERPHFIYVPQCPAGQTWVSSPWASGSYSVDKVAASQSMAKLTDVLAGLLKEFSIDENRIYVIGISMGGQATWDLLCRHPKMFAGAVPICGCGDSSKASLLGSVGIWAFHGSDDPTVPVRSDREIMANFEKAGTKVLRLTADPAEQPTQKHIYSEYKVGHNVWDQAIALNRYVVPWLFSQSRAANPSRMTKPTPSAKPATPAAESATKPAAPAGEKTVMAGGATLRLGMTKAEVMAQMAKTPDAGWFVPEQDSPPTDELYKMDKWGLAYKDTTGALPGGGLVTLIFVNERVSSIEGGGDKK